MDKTLIAQVEKLVEWRIENLGGTPSVEEVVTSLKRGRLNTGALPVPHEAVSSFRNRRNTDKCKLVQKALLRRTQTALPNVAAEAVAAPPTPAVPETVPATTSAPTIQPRRNEALAEIARKGSLELKEEGGEVYISLRCFEQLIGKRPENLSRTLAARGFPLRDVMLPNERGQLRETPAISLDYIFAVVGLADLHGMSPGERNQLFTLQRELPGWMKRYNQFAVQTTPPSPLPPNREEETKLVTGFVNRIVNIFTDGIARLTERLDGRFDRIEKILTPTFATRPPHGTPLPVTTNGVTAVQPPILTASGLSKISSRPPLKDLNSVTTEINKFVGMIGSYSARDIIRRAEKLGIWKSPLWGADKVGVENALLLDGESITWWIDSDGVELLKQDIRRESTHLNGGRPSLS